MFTRLVVEDTSFDFLDPDASILRDALPTRGYEPAVCALLARSIARPGSVFFDIGALYGFFAVWAELHAPEAQVVAFEPGAVYARVLELNLALNGCSRARVERVALSDRGGKAAFAARSLATDGARPPLRKSYVRGLVNHLRREGADGVGEIVTAAGHWRAGFRPWLAAAVAERLGLFRHGSDQEQGEVVVQPLDEWVAASGLRPTVAKIDVHGAEVEVLRGMSRALRDDVRELIVEVHTEDLLTTGSHEEVVERLEEAELEVFELRGFRNTSGRLVPLDGVRRRRFCDQRQWTSEELYFMRCLYARRREAG